MILRFEMSEVRSLLVAYLEQRPAPAVLVPPEEQTAPPEEDGQAVSREEPESGPPAEPAATEVRETPVETAEPRQDPSREKTEQAISALCAEARGEGIICMGLRAHLDPYFIVRTFADVLGCSDREARAAFQAYIKKHPSESAQS